MPQKSAPQPGQAPQPKDARDGANGKRGGAADDADKLADLYKDVWGHLPEALRLEMDQYAREQFMGKYRDLLKQYYTTIAEKGRRKGN